MTTSIESQEIEAVETIEISRRAILSVCFCRSTMSILMRPFSLTLTSPPFGSAQGRLRRKNNFFLEKRGDDGVPIFSFFILAPWWVVEIGLWRFSFHTLHSKNAKDGAPICHSDRSAQAREQLQCVFPVDLAQYILWKEDATNIPATLA